MPDEAKRARRLGEQLDNANERIRELEQKVIDLQTALNLQIANNGVLTDIRELVNNLITAFTMHINVNTDAINILDKTVTTVMGGVEKQLELQSKVLLATGSRDGANS